MMRVLHVGDPPPDFPRTPVLDDFNRPDGRIGGNWIGPGTVGTRRFSIRDNAVQVRSTLGLLSYMFWDGGTFGPDQEAYFTFNQVSPTTNDQALLLKVNNLARRGVVGLKTELIGVTYDATKSLVEVKTLSRGLRWEVQRTFEGVSFADGDVFGARAQSDGTVTVFRNREILGTVTVNQLAGAGGQLGVWFVGRASNGNEVRYDDFGGGDI